MERNRKNSGCHGHNLNKLSDNSEKVLNVQSGDNVLIYICNTFIEVLEEFTTESTSNEVHEQLKKVHDLLGRKLYGVRGVTDINMKDVGDTVPGNLSLLKPMTSSTLSLKAGHSRFEIEEHDPLYKEFLINVNCPFCFKSEMDKIKLVKHLDESCTPLMNNTFEERNFIEFSAFQILPNNTFKCNVCHNSVEKDIKHFFLHRLSTRHNSNYMKLSKSKKYTDFLFCSCCKVLIPNNFTQLDYHMKHKIHRERSLLAPTSTVHKQISCLYLKTKKFKCLNCPKNRSIHQTTKDVLEHFDHPEHRKNMPPGLFPLIFCELCNEEIRFFEVITHFTSKKHTAREKTAPLEDWFEMCYYCGFTCDTLKELSVHVKTNCKEINYIREKSLKLKDDDQKIDKSVKKTIGKVSAKKNKSKKIPEPITKQNVMEVKDNLKESPYIIVKDNTDVLDIYQYFQKLGEITGVEIYKGKNVLVRFVEKSAVEAAMELRDVIKIKGVKVEITTDEDLMKPTDNTRKSEMENLTDSDDSDPEHLQELFERVPDYLLNTAGILSSDTEENILKDCSLDFGAGKCSLVGFTGCELSFPVESVSLFVNLSVEIPFETHTASYGDFHRQNSLFKTFYKELCNTPRWEKAICTVGNSIPVIECVHKETAKECSFTCAPSAESLTFMLRCCIKADKRIKRLCLIIRFWLSIHKLKIREFEFAVLALIVFFLMERGVAPDFDKLLVLPAKLRSFFNWLNGEIGNQPSVSLKKNLDLGNVCSTFKGFLRFLEKFDFVNNAICLPLKYAVPKAILQKHPLLTPLHRARIMNSHVCIVDPHLFCNLTAGLSEGDVHLMLEIVRATRESMKM